MKNTNWIIISFIVFLMTSCVIIYNTQDMKIPNEDFLVNENILNTNGYYYRYDSSFTYPYIKNSYPYFENTKIWVKSITPIIFYKNGYVKIEASFIDEKNTYNSIHENIMHYILKYDPFKYNGKADIWNWGTYFIQSDSINILYYQNYLGDYSLVGLYGIIQKNSTIKFYKYAFNLFQDEKDGVKFINKNYKFIDIDETYTFYEFEIPQKPNYIMMNKSKFGK